jgi:hypothetical protein
MFDYLVTALGFVAGIGMLCILIIGAVKLLDLFLNELDDRDPWK